MHIKMYFFYLEKVYEDVEDMFRMKIFLENKQKVAKHNQLYGQGNKTYSLKLNQFGDQVGSFLDFHFLFIYNFIH